MCWLAYQCKILQYPENFVYPCSHCKLYSIANWCDIRVASNNLLKVFNAL